MISAKNNVQMSYEELSVTFDVGALSSDVVDFKGQRLFAVAIPVGAGDVTLTFEVERVKLGEGKEWVSFNKGGAPYELVIKDGSDEEIDYARFASAKSIKIIRATSTVALTAVLTLRSI